MLRLANVFRYFVLLVLLLPILFACEKEKQEDPDLPTVYAGQDTLVYDSTVIHLYAFPPEAGQGEWKILSGSGGSLLNVYDPGTRFQGMYNETYYLLWQVLTDNKVYTDTLSVTFKERLAPPVAYAGNNRVLDDTLVVRLQANLPDNAEGTWRLLEGEGSIANPQDPNSLFYAESFQSTCVLQWKLVNAAGADSASVSYTFENTAVSSFVCGDVWLDPRDGQSYRTVEVAGVCWFAENLNYGTMIDASNVQSNNGMVEKYCYSNQESYCDDHGGLYQWNEMMDYATVEGVKGICPDGWRVSTDEDWLQAEMALGMAESDALLNNIWRGTNQGTKMKQGGSSGLEIQMSGRYVSGFGYMGSHTYLWTSNELGSEAYRRCFSASASNIGRYTSFGKDAGFSVRCVKE